MQVHEFFAAVAPMDECEAVIGGRVCGDHPDDRIHKFIAGYGCYYPTVTVQVFVYPTRRREHLYSVHYATFFWQAEDEDSWYSGWYASHNNPSEYLRLEAIDCKTFEDMQKYITKILLREYTPKELELMGVKN